MQFKVVGGPKDGEHIEVIADAHGRPLVPFLEFSPQINSSPRNDVFLHLIYFRKKVINDSGVECYEFHYKE